MSGNRSGEIKKMDINQHKDTGKKLMQIQTLLDTYKKVDVTLIDTIRANFKPLFQNVCALIEEQQSVHKGASYKELVRVGAILKKTEYLNGIESDDFEKYATILLTNIRDGLEFIFIQEYADVFESNDPYEDHWWNNVYYHTALDTYHKRTNTMVPEVRAKWKKKKRDEAVLVKN